ncbi:sodium-dependent proline transporter [Eurytemora carolleeae]|uniref:sodium-dependent proline transporter n=1 Tax=Eurytemora carolleeae TaxID=1294199 RepID=UPI000C76DEBC|nr:sodium-dependent proline transporter [Eurytemora carolleeae]|eukprot:XP_023325122.1 sodium-dependent proline transporter-like [Eurytemora affinis]
MYFLVLLLVGAPALLLEMFLGQYSGLAPMRLFRHLCPILSGLGLTIFVQAAVRLFLELGVLSWSGQTLFLVFSQQNIRDGFFYRDVLNKDKGDLEELGSVSGELCLVLGIGTVLIFILVTIIIIVQICGSCIADGGLQGVTMLLTPNWIKLTDPTAWLEATSQVDKLTDPTAWLEATSQVDKLTDPTAWLEATSQVDKLTDPAAWLEATLEVVFSLQLGIGAVLSYGSYNKFNQNIVRDAIIGQGMWLLGVTALESAISSLSYGWLWGGLLFVLIVLVCISSIFGYLEVMTGSIVAIRPSLIPYRPLITFLILVVFFLLDIFMTTQGGINVYHLVNTYIATWPQLLIVLLTVLPAVLCHGTRNMMKDLSEMSKVCFHHFVTSQEFRKRRSMLING